MKAERKPPSLMRTSTRPGLHSEPQMLRSPLDWPEPAATIPSMWKWLALTLSDATVTVAPAAGRTVTAVVFVDCEIDCEPYAPAATWTRSPLWAIEKALLKLAHGFDESLLTHVLSLPPGET